MLNIECYDYTIIAKDEAIINELKEMDKDNKIQVNWFNFEQGDIYYSNDCIEYYVTNIDHINKSLELSKDIRDLVNHIC